MMQQCKRDFPYILGCHRTVDGSSFKIRFVKHPDPKSKSAKKIRMISSTRVRRLLGEYPQRVATLKSIVLSPDLLLSNWFSWLGEVKKARGSRISFPSQIEAFLETPVEMISSLETPSPKRSASLIAEFGDDKVNESLSEAKDLINTLHMGSLVKEDSEGEERSGKRLKRSTSVDFNIGVEKESWLPVPIREMGFCYEMP